MLYRGMKLSVVGTGMVLAASAFAEGQSPKVGFEYRAGITYDDGKLQETDDVDAKSTTDIDLEYADIVVEGAAAPNVNYRFAYSLVGSEIAAGVVDYKFNDMVAFNIGYDTAIQGGWNFKDSCTTYAHTEGPAACAYSAPLSGAVNYAGVSLALAGTLKIAAMNDVANASVAKNEDEKRDGINESGSSAGYKNEDQDTQAVAIEWTGNFDGWMPLVQLLNYDRSNSMAISLGVKGEVAGLSLMANYITDNRKNFVTDPKDGEIDNHTAIDVHVGYAVAGFTPWLAYHQMNVKQGGTDAKTNSMNTETGEYEWNDQAQSISVGVNCTAISTAYVPYLTVNSQSGKWMEADKEETKSNMVIKAGVMGKF